MPDIFTEAAEWHERMFGLPGDATSQAFEAWRRASGDHARAYELVCAAHDEAAALAGEQAMLALRHEAVTRAMLVRRPARIKRRAIAAGVLLLASAPLAALGLHGWHPFTAERMTEESFRTDIGQQAEVTLPDGSTVTLDTASRLRVAFTGDERRVMLDGQGWFDLKPSARPFVIVAGDRTMTADAGRFDVRTDPGQVRAFAADGTLSIANGAEGAAVALDPGRLIAMSGSEAAIRRLDDPQSVTGWRTGMLQFDDVRLADAVGELNRYRRTPIRVADTRAADLRISGSFHTAESPAFLDALTTGFPVRVTQDSGAAIVIAAR